MKRVAMLLLLIVAVAFPATAGPKKKTTTLFGTDGPGDRAAIQAAIDAAGKGDTIELVGRFQLDGISILIADRGDITIAGREIDDDGDGAVNEDWVDGNDNDGDGSVDEDPWDAVIEGIAAGDGGPEEFPWSLHNRAFRIGGNSGTERNVVIEGIEFSTLVRGVTFAGDSSFNNHFECDDIVVTGGSINNSTVRRNHFTNVERGAQVFGSADHITFTDNLATNINPGINAAAYAFLLLGGDSTCRDADGNAALFTVGLPRRTNITDNTVIGSTWAGIGGFSAPQTHVSGNVLDGQGAARWAVILGDDSPKVHVSHNTVSGFSRGPTMGSTDARVQNNTVDGADNGFIVYAEGSGNLFVNNTATNSATAYFLDILTFDNMIRLNGNNDVSEIIDFGTDNSIKK